jgi:hypothetical protein
MWGRPPRHGASSGCEWTRLPIYLEGSCECLSREQPTRGCPPAWGFGRGVTNAHCKKQLVTKYYIGHRYWTDSLDLCGREILSRLKTSIRLVGGHIFSLIIRFFFTNSSLFRVSSIPFSADASLSELYEETDGYLLIFVKCSFLHANINRETRVLDSLDK